ncbi:CBO0543 family protein [Anoxybacteroides tepidamans]|uniref:CBO0543 family protein n=1 Tax=Anoxybacteroides tepidamans TaxID=265948 RepID=UPI000A96E378|nr:CBO0543 family protein [Anoxybacillus tepidamans]
MSLLIRHELEYIVTAVAIVGSIFGSYFIIKLDWRKYGLLYLISGVSANIVCILFLALDFYKFPVTPLNGALTIPFTALLTTFPYYVLLGVRYSPRRWAWKIPFYWGMVHLGVTAEKLLEEYTKIIQYEKFWDTFDSYAAWWIYLLIFEYVGGRLIPPHLRKPIHIKAFRYGNWAWLLLHFILILSIFLAGVYVGTLL